jgi:hypothetical protein
MIKENMQMLKLFMMHLSFDAKSMIQIIDTWY